MTCLLVAEHSGRFRLINGALTVYGVRGKRLAEELIVRRRQHAPLSAATLPRGSH